MNYTKYDCKTEPKQWLRVYSQAVDLAGGDDDIKALFLPTALDSLPLSWFDRIPAGIVDTWQELHKLFVDNFAGYSKRPGAHNDLRSCKQRDNESMRDYYKRFTEVRMNVDDILDREVIEFFSYSIKERWMFQQFIEQKPRKASDFHAAVETLIETEERTKE